MTAIEEFPMADSSLVDSTAASPVTSSEESAAEASSTLSLLSSAAAASSADSQGSIPFMDECKSANFSDDDAIMMFNVTKFVDTVKIEPTELRKNALYYRIYCIGLNTIFSSAFPLLSLLYLNIYTVLALRKIGRENGLAVSSRLSNAPRAANNDHGAIELNDQSKNKQQLESTSTKSEEKKAVQDEINQQCRTQLCGGNRRWRKRCTAFEMSILKKQRQRSKKTTEKHISMRFVRETHSIEVVMSCKAKEAKSGKDGCRKKPPLAKRKVRSKANNGKGDYATGSVGHGDSYASGCGHGIHVRARSESQCDYSPKKRNEAQMLQKRRGFNNIYTQTGRTIRNIRAKSENFRRRANSAPDEIQSITDDSNKRHSHGGHSESSLSNLPSGSDLCNTTTTAPLLVDSSSSSVTSPRSHVMNPFGEADGVSRVLPPSETAVLRMTLLRSGEARLTRIALAIVWLFIFCHAWRLVPTVYEALYSSNDSWPQWMLHVHGISHSFIVFNSAVNFLLYTVL